MKPYDKVIWTFKTGLTDTRISGTVLEIGHWVADKSNGLCLRLLKVRLDTVPSRIIWDTESMFELVKPPLPQEPTQLGYVYYYAGKMFVRHGWSEAISPWALLGPAPYASSSWQRTWSWEQIHERF